MESIVICGKGKITIDTLATCKEKLKNHRVIYCYIHKEQIRINCVDFAKKAGFDCFEIKNYESLALFIKEINPVYILLIQFSMIIKEDLILFAKNKIINLHHANLPYFRGVGPITQAILNGSNKFGVTLHFVDSQIDTGNIILQKTFPIKNKTNEQVFNECLHFDREIISKLLNKIARNEKIKSKIQDDSKATYYSKDKLNYDNPLIDFNNTANQISLFCLAYTFPSQNLFPKYHYKEKIYTFINIPIIGERCPNFKCGTLIEEDKCIRISSSDRWLIFNNFIVQH